MPSRASYEPDLERLFEEYFRKGDSREMQAYLMSHSNLPGPRGNLELVAAFAGAVAKSLDSYRFQLKTLCISFSEITALDAPVNSRGEFIPVCGVVGLGAIGAENPGDMQEVLEYLYLLSSDSRWRVREAVAMALQNMIGKHGISVLHAIKSWIETANWLPMRAVVAGVAEPATLQDRDVASQAMELHRAVFEEIQLADDRRSDEFYVLRKGLSYTLSVVVCALPEEGFALMHELVATGDRDIIVIVRENVKKNRLLRRYPEQVSEVAEAIRMQSSE